MKTNQKAFSAGEKDITKTCVAIGLFLTIVGCNGLILTLAGCGGAEFTAVDKIELPPTEDAGRTDAGNVEGGGDDVAMSDAGVDTGNVADASAHDSAASDVAAEAAPTCTPFDGGMQTCGSGQYSAPARYCEYSTIGAGSFVDNQTPSKCLCAETYDCECLSLPNVNQGCSACGCGGHVLSCQQVGDKITLTCG